MTSNSQLEGAEYTVGICLTGGSSGILELAKSVLNGETSNLLRKLVIVASGSQEDTAGALRELQLNDSRLEMVVEDARHGKADAVNKIIARTSTPILILANSDAVPGEHAIPELLAAAMSDVRAGAVSAIPIPGASRGLLSLQLGLMWGAHNDCSIKLNHLNKSNHSCDELVLFRTDAITRLPEGLVNDGAYLAAAARLKGYTVKVCQRALVYISTPKRPSDVVLQRRRILFGHVQVWHKIGTPPKTIESLIFMSPAQSLGIMVHTLAKDPRFMAAAPTAVVSEFLAALLSIADTIRSSTEHAIWRRFT